MGCCMLLAVALATDVSVRMLVECGRKVRAQSYESLGMIVLGKPGFLAVCGSILLFAFGAMCAYMVIIGDTMTSVLQYASDSEDPPERWPVILVSGVVLILPLCLLREMASLSKTSLLSVLSDVVLILIVVATAAETAKREDT